MSSIAHGLLAIFDWYGFLIPYFGYHLPELIRTAVVFIVSRLTHNLIPCILA
jgi:hypothetical protein